MTRPYKREVAVKAALVLLLSISQLRALEPNGEDELTLGAELVGTIGGRIRYIKIHETHGYILEGQDLVVLDLSDPTNPTICRRQHFGSMGEVIKVAGSRLYISTVEGGFRIFDVSDACDPTPIGNFGTLGSVQGFAVSGTRLYAAIEGHGLRGFDVSDASRPITLNTQIDIEFVVAATDTRLYALGSDATFEVIDISNPAAPDVLGKYRPQIEVPDNLSRSISIISADVEDDHAFLAVQEFFFEAPTIRLEILKIAEPSEIIRSASINLTLHHLALRAGSINVGGSLLSVMTLPYFSPGPQPAIKFVDIADTTDPKILGQIVLESLSSNLELIESPSISPTGASMFFSASADDGMHIFDLSDPLHPILIGRYATLIDPVGLDVAGDLVYVAHGSSFIHTAEAGVKVFNVADPTLPSIAGHYETPGQPRDVAVSGSTAYIADGDAGLHIVDFADLSEPNMIGTVQLGGFAERVTLSPGLAIVAASEAGAVLVDVANPIRPVIRSAVEIPGQSVLDISVEGGLAYIWATGGQFAIFDIVNPDMPQFRSSLQFDVPSFGGAIEVIGSRAYLSSVRERDFVIVDVSDPLDPFVIGSLEQSAGSDLVVEGRLAYNASSAFRVIDVLDPAGPTVRGLHFFSTSSRLSTSRASPFIFVNEVRRIALSTGLIYATTTVNGLEIIRFEGALPTIQKDAALFRHRIVEVNDSRNRIQLEIKIGNVGSEAWSQSDGFKLALLDDPCGIWTELYPRIDLPDGVTIAQGEDHTFVTELRTVSAAAPCALRFQMVQELVEFFGPPFEISLGSDLFSAAGNWVDYP